MLYAKCLLEPQQHSADDPERPIDRGGFIIANRERPEVFHPIDSALDAISQPIDDLVEFTRSGFIDPVRASPDLHYRDQWPFFHSTSRSDLKQIEPPSSGA